MVVLPVVDLPARRIPAIPETEPRLRHLNETLFLSLAHARVEIAAWTEDYNRERPHSSLGYETPAAFAAGLDRQWLASLRPAGSATKAIATTALMRNKIAGL
jgi:hypothetical protein